MLEFGEIESGDLAVEEVVAKENSGRREVGSKEPLKRLLERSRVWMVMGKEQMIGQKRELKLKSRVRRRGGRAGRRPERWLWERFMWARKERFGRVREVPERFFSSRQRCVTRGAPLWDVQATLCQWQQLVEGDQLRLREGDWEEMNDSKESCSSLLQHSIPFIEGRNKLR
ncbi:hypothetical protein SASPL_138115 [Salvia splendens]|uniref:Uncharacterized protein n=1 Tax=Salvia splendens TaxID=180675 RepID=A0A8X8ZEP3_SALSN|nr:hypothetical protein SASPL_138115 [Salvia splendens]